MAKMEIKGKEAIKAPKTSFFFAISLAPTINTPERRIRNASCTHAIALVGTEGLSLLWPNSNFETVTVRLGMSKKYLLEDIPIITLISQILNPSTWA